MVMTSTPTAACTANLPSSRNLSPRKLNLAALKVEPIIIYSYVISKFLMLGKGTAVQPKRNTPLWLPFTFFLLLSLLANSRDWFMLSLL